jgi:hypothetical protein
MDELGKNTSEELEESTAVVDEGKDLDEDEDEDLTAVEKITGVYTSPDATFKYLSLKPDFWTAFIVISLISIALGMIAMPKMLPAMEEGAVTQMAPMFQGSPEEQDAQMAIGLKTVRIMAYVQAFLAPIGYLIAWLIYVVLIYFIGMVMGHDVHFKRLWGVVPWATFISILGQIATTAVIATRESFTMAQLQDMHIVKPYSALAIVPSTTEIPYFVEAILASIDPFLIWGFFVLAFAVFHSNKCSRAHAYMVTGITIAIMILGGAGLAAMGHMMQPGAN